MPFAPIPPSFQANPCAKKNRNLFSLSRSLSPPRSLARSITYPCLDLQTADLLWSLNLPYKFTYGGFVGVCIICAYMATTIPAPAKFMWFGEISISQ